MIGATADAESVNVIAGATPRIDVQNRYDPERSPPCPPCGVAPRCRDEVSTTCVSGWAHTQSTEVVKVSQVESLIAGGTDSRVGVRIMRERSCY